MLTYEDLADLLLDTADEVGLEPTDVAHLIEYPSGRRTFSMFCVPEGWEPPYDVEAEIRFSYEASDIALSMYGVEEFCALFHGDDVDCPHRELTPDVAIVLEVKYLFRAPDVPSVPELTGNLRRMFQRQINHDNQPEVKFEVSSLPDATLVVHQAYAYYWWELQDELFKEDPDVTPILAEIRQVLEALKASGLIPSGGDDDLEE